MCPDARERAHALKHRLEQVHVDHLAFAGAVAVAQRDHHGERPDDGGDLVGKRDRRQKRAPVGFVRPQPTQFMASAKVADPGRPA